MIIGVFKHFYYSLQAWLKDIKWELIGKEVELHNHVLTYLLLGLQQFNSLMVQNDSRSLMSARGQTIYEKNEAQ